MTTRRLAAILAADVVGFSSMMEKRSRIEVWVTRLLDDARGARTETARFSLLAPRR